MNDMLLWRLALGFGRLVSSRVSGVLADGSQGSILAQNYKQMPAEHMWHVARASIFGWPFLSTAPLEIRRSRFCCYCTAGANVAAGSTVVLAFAFGGGGW